MEVSYGLKVKSYSLEVHYNMEVSYNVEVKNYNMVAKRQFEGLQHATSLYFSDTQKLVKTSPSLANILMLSFLPPYCNS